ncbi:MAG: zinc ribbon domain-containing protein [Planctomycetes bacterium]|nr:zinc ribbon domain-containing protein [Planctomycetota bacterium]
MPTYDYACGACGHRFELFQSIRDGARRKCPSCGRLKLRRLIGAGSAVLFRGPGFYQTDYRSPEYERKAKADKEASSSSKTDTSSSESKTEKTGTTGDSGD